MQHRVHAVLSLCAALVGTPIPLRADVVTLWNSAALEAIRNESTSPPLAARNLAILHAAIFDAVNSLERKYDPYLFQPNSPPGTSPEAAAVGAAHACLLRLYPSQAALFDQVLEQTLAAVPDGPGREDGLTLGQLVALLTLAWRGADGASTTVPYIPATDPGEWRRTPPFFRPPELPHWPWVVPFAMTNGAQFRPAGPPSLTSSRYAEDINLTKELGALDSHTRTAEQTLIARFWSDFSFTVTPPGHWNQIARNVAEHTTNTLGQNARLFALLNLAMADAGIASWDAKYYYNFWRPVTAIREAATDDNDATEADPGWTPLLNSPPFPEYVSGHSTFSAAASVVLADFFGTDQVSFTIGSDTLPEVLRTYDSFAAAAEEIGLSRIYGGIHFLSADLDGLEMGRRLGALVGRTLLRPKAEPAGLRIERNLVSEGLSVILQGTDGRAYVLQSSVNLVDWDSVATNAAPFQWDAPATSSNPVRFFRARAAE